ncbi:MAG: TIGR01458 family HAD-type hydrolase [Proteobacteria bacterium]|nr:TIGR01458 family HAD-type hydrolase [Pseudomonadota bacterium]
MISGILLDLAGVLYVGDTPLPGAREAIERLHQARLPTRYLTNTTRSTRRAILDRLSRMGLSIPPDSLYTAPLAAWRYVESHGLRPYLLIHPNLKAEFAEFGEGPYNAVLVGDGGEAFTYERLNCAFRLLLEGAPLLAMGNNRYFKEGDGFSLDVGPFVTALEYAAGVRATILGKPAPDFFRAAIADLGCKADEVMMVGDDVAADVIGAVSAGLQGVLVKTGKYRPGDENQLKSANANVLADVTAAIDWIITQC